MQQQAPPAQSVQVLPAEVHELSAITLESMPPQFVLRGLRTMPTPGWELRIDRVEEDVDQSGERLLVFITEVPPEGIVPQVLHPTEVRIPLGALSPGRHLLALYTRRGEDPYDLLQAMVVEAT
jgi:hypothetical protein